MHDSLAVLRLSLAEFARGRTVIEFETEMVPGVRFYLAPGKSVAKALKLPRGQTFLVSEVREILRVGMTKDEARAVITAKVALRGGVSGVRRDTTVDTTATATVKAPATATKKAQRERAAIRDLFS